MAKPANEPDLRTFLFVVLAGSLYVGLNFLGSPGPGTGRWIAVSIAGALAATSALLLWGLSLAHDPHPCPLPSSLRSGERESCSPRGESPIRHWAREGAAPSPRRAAPGREGSDEGNPDDDERCGVYEIKRDAQGRVVRIRDFVSGRVETHTYPPPIADWPTGPVLPAFPRPRYLN